MQRDVGVAWVWLARKSDHCWDMRVPGAGYVRHTRRPSCWAVEDVAAAFPGTLEETRAQPGNRDENGKSSEAIGAGLPERPPHPVGEDGFPLPHGPGSYSRLSWEDCALGTGLGGGAGRVAEEIKFLLTFVENLLCATGL